MSYRFSASSEKRLVTCHPELQRLLRVLLVKKGREQSGDFIILCGHRGEQEQNKAFRDGNSKLAWPHSKHNKTPSQAVDIAPYPLDWRDLGAFESLSWHVKRTAIGLGIEIRWGGDWVAFQDMPHYELTDAFYQRTLK